MILLLPNKRPGWSGLSNRMLCYESALLAEEVWWLWRLSTEFCWQRSTDWNLVIELWPSRGLSQMPTYIWSSFKIQYYTQNSVFLLGPSVRPSLLGDPVPPGFWNGVDWRVESSGQRLISLNDKTNRKAFFLFKKKKVYCLSKGSDFFVFLCDFFRFFDFLLLLKITSIFWIIFYGFSGFS